MNDHLLPTVALTPGGFAARWEGPSIAAMGSADIDAILEALIRCGVLVLRAQHPDPDTLETFADRLGIADVVHPAEHRLPGSGRLRLQSNVPGHGVSGGGGYWHADGSWMPTPTAATVLACAEAPSDTGATTFVDAAAAHASLTPALAARADVAIGHYPNRAILERELADLGISDPEMLGATADASHPLVRRHPLTDAPALILNEVWLERVAGCTDEESAALLAALYECVESSPHRYVHHWQTGDVVVWDNSRVLHRADAVEEGQRKVTWRATLASLHQRGAG